MLDELGSPTLKKYRLLGQLAKGGMAEVFLARADGLGGFERLLVIKRILPELASDTEFVRMFLDEARIAATLHHTSIVQVHEVDIADGQVFYAMEHLHGQDVATTLQRLTERAMRMPLGNAIAIIAAVAAGLHYAHERCSSDGQPLDIVHRDVAPNNVIVTYDGNVKLIDFGIAKAANNLSRTRFGLFKGKLPYASPEQCRCELVDRRTDVFSLGVLLYELTTGQRLFTADNEYELIRVVSEAVVPRPRLRDKAYPRDLEAIVLKALAQSRDDRYPSAHALQRDLEAFANRMQLDLSAMSLSRLMERLFTNDLTQWRSAERAGVTLEQHIITTTKKLAPDHLMAARPHDDFVAEAPSDVTRTSVRGRSAPRPDGSAVTDPSDVIAAAEPLGIDSHDMADASDMVDAGGMTSPVDPSPGGVGGAHDLSQASAADPNRMAGPNGIDPSDGVSASNMLAPSNRGRSGATRYALIAAAAVGLLGAGALGALWVSARPPRASAVPAGQPATPGLAPSDLDPAPTGPAAVAPALSEQATETPAASDPAPRSSSTEPASQTPPAPRQAATSPVPAHAPTAPASSEPGPPTPAPSEPASRARPSKTEPQSAAAPAPTEPVSAAAPTPDDSVTMEAPAATEPGARAAPGSVTPERPVQPPAAVKADPDTEHAAPHPTRKTKRTHPRPTSTPHPPPAGEPPATAAPAAHTRPVLDDATLDKVVPRSTGSR